ncbi:hypothetical protein EV359DRAFT_67267 [Lentinula novae-zelandiae]|nr:hypothetical protein EV359DRAFT_67267 [Lentinula novae-zelandiae]
MHLKFNFPVFLFLVSCAVSASTVVYAMPFQANSESTPSLHSQIARANSRPPVTAIVNFLDHNGGNPIGFAGDNGFIVSSGMDAQLHGIMPSEVYNRVRHAVEFLVPSADRGRGLVLGFENHFVPSAKDHEDDHIRITLHGIEQYPNGCWLDVNKEGKIVPGMFGETWLENEGTFLGCYGQLLDAITPPRRSSPILVNLLLNVSFSHLRGIKQMRRFGVLCALLPPIPLIPLIPLSLLCVPQFYPSFQFSDSAKAMECGGVTECGRRNSAKAK